MGACAWASTAFCGRVLAGRGHFVLFPEESLLPLRRDKVDWLRLDSPESSDLPLTCPRCHEWDTASWPLGGAGGPGSLHVSSADNLRASLTAGHVSPRYLTWPLLVQGQVFCGVCPG